MLRRFLRDLFSLAVFLTFATPMAMADDGPLLLTRSEFEALAAELAPKVTLFNEVWKLDPQAEFFGGTSRDYLYWIKGNLKRAKNRGDAERIVAELRSMPMIDVREFILYDSDVDVVSKNGISLDGTRFGIKKIDNISAKRFDPSTPEGQNELHQGFIPVEKIRLSRTGIVRSDVFADGVGEIHSSKLTVQFAADAEFNETHFAKRGLNHPVLLAFRYIRLLALDDFKNNGRKIPTLERLLARADDKSIEMARKLISRASHDPSFTAAMKNAKFVEWLNGTIQKAFRATANPNSALVLMENLGGVELITRTQGLEPINQYLFAKARHPEIIAENWRKYGFDPAETLVPVRSLFPDGKLYHGTRTETAFRAILFQGILPSGDGSGGDGLYGVAKDNVVFAENWGGSPDRVVEIEISPDARILDVSKGHALFTAYARGNVSDPAIYTRFAEEFGIDILKYPYTTDAYVVKNGGVLKAIQGSTRKLMKFTDIENYLNRVPREKLIEAMIQTSLDNRVTTDEFDHLLQNVERRLGPEEAKMMIPRLHFDSLRVLDVSPFTLTLFDTIAARSRDAAKKQAGAYDLPDWMLQRIELILSKMSPEQVGATMREGLAKEAPYLTLVALTSLVRKLLPRPWEDFHKASMTKAESQQAPMANKRILQILSELQYRNVDFKALGAPEILKIAANQEFNGSTPRYDKPLALALAVNPSIDSPEYKAYFDQLRSMAGPMYLLSLLEVVEANAKGKWTYWDQSMVDILEKARLGPVPYLSYRNLIPFLDRLKRKFPDHYARLPWLSMVEQTRVGLHDSLREFDAFYHFQILRRALDAQGLWRSHDGEKIVEEFLAFDFKAADPNTAARTLSGVDYPREARGWQQALEKNWSSSPKYPAWIAGASGQRKTRTIPNCRSLFVKVI